MKQHQEVKEKRKGIEGGVTFSLVSFKRGGIILQF